MANIYLPVQDILDLIASRGGLAMILSNGESDNSRDPSGEQEYNTADFKRQHMKYRSVLRRAKEKGGMISVFAADDLAINLLNTHPCFIYPNWFDLDAEAESITDAA